MIALREVAAMPELTPSTRELPRRIGVIETALRNPETVANSQ